MYRRTKYFVVNLKLGTYLFKTFEMIAFMRSRNNELTLITSYF